MKLSIHHGDCLDILRQLPSDSVHCVVTSPPYWALRDYGVEGQLGLEPTPEEYIANMVAVFAEVKRVLRPDGTLWLNIGEPAKAKKLTGLIVFVHDRDPMSKAGFLKEVSRLRISKPDRLDSLSSSAGVSG